MQVDSKTKEPVCRRDELLDQLKWQADRFGRGRGDDKHNFALHDVDAVYTILFLMVRALENGGAVSCVPPASFVCSSYRSRRVGSLHSTNFMRSHTGTHTCMFSSGRSSPISQWTAMAWKSMSM